LLVVAPQKVCDGPDEGGEVGLVHGGSVGTAGDVLFVDDGI